MKLSLLAKNIVNTYQLLPALFGGRVDNTGATTISAYGHKTWNSDAMADDDTSFVLGSCSKSLSAAMIIKVCFENGVGVDTITIGSVIPTVKTEYKDVTLRQLLCMTSGIYDGCYIDDINFWTDFINNYDNLRDQRALLTDKICGKDALGPFFTPGTAYSYSNLGYAVAVHIIETKFNSTYENLMNEYLFKKLKFTAELPANNIPSGSIGHALTPASYMNFWYSDTLKKIDPVLQDPSSVSYQQMTAYIVDTPIMQYPPPIGGPFGAIRINMPNWLKYISAIMMHDPKFLPEDQWQMFLNSGSVATTKAWSPPPTGSPPGTPGKITKSSYRYSFGWGYREGREEILEYTGYIYTFTTDLIIHQKNCALVTSTNSGSGKNVPILPLKILQNEMCPNNEKILKSIIQAGIKFAPAWPKYPKSN